MSLKDTCKFLTLHGQEAFGAVEALGALRIAVFREFPYLYAGSLTYERSYLQTYFRSSKSVVILVEHDGRVVGAATGLPLSDAEDAIRLPLITRGIDASRVFYCGEALLMPEYRGQGLSKQIFAIGDAYTREIGAQWQAFVTVVRPENHPLRPADYVPLDSLWRARGFTKLEGVTASMGWRDIDQSQETDHTLDYWIKSVTP